MKEEHGSITLWMVGLVMVVFALGGISIDLWRGLSAHRYVASMADAAAIAAGSGIDEDRWRVGGELVLLPSRVEERVAAAFAAQTGGPEVIYELQVTPEEATITATTTVELTLLALLVDGDLEVSATAAASPTLSP